MARARALPLLFEYVRAAAIESEERAHHLGCHLNGVAHLECCVYYTILYTRAVQLVSCPPRVRFVREHLSSAAQHSAALVSAFVGVSAKAEDTCAAHLGLSASRRVASPSDRILYSSVQ